MVSKLYKLLEFGTCYFYFTIGKYCGIAINQETLMYLNRISGRLIKGLEVWFGRLLCLFTLYR